MKEVNSGCGSNGRDFSSGWYCTPMNQGWSGNLDDLRQDAVRRHAGEPQADLLQPVLVVDVDLVAMAVALADHVARRRSRAPACRGRRAPDRRPAAWCRRGRRWPRAVRSGCRVTHSVIRPTTGVLARAELGRRRAAQAEQVARRLDHRHLHAEADAEERHLAFAREPHRLDLALGAALAEAARHQDAVHVLEMAAPRRPARRSRSPPSPAAPSRCWRCRHGSAPRPATCSVEQDGVLADHGDASPRPPGSRTDRRRLASATDRARRRRQAEIAAAPRGRSPAS